MRNIRKGTKVYYKPMASKKSYPAKVTSVERIKGRSEQKRVGAKAYVNVTLKSGEKRWGYPQQFRKRK